MWVFTNKGFISAVAHNQRQDIIIIRARVREHLRDLFNNEKIIETHDSDYQFRIFVDRSIFVEFLSNQANNLKYTNYKASISDIDYHNSCLNVWRIMARLQENNKI